MTFHHQLMKAGQDDARRAGERDRLLLEARRARGALRQRPDPDAPAWRLIRRSFRRIAASHRTFPASPEQMAESRVHTSLSPVNSSGTFSDVISAE